VASVAVVTTARPPMQLRLLRLPRPQKEDRLKC